MKKSLVLTPLLVATILSGCASPTPPPTPTSVPTPAFTPTPRPPIEIQVTECGYADHGWVTMTGTVTNNTDETVAFLQAVVALVKNTQVVRTDEISIVNSTGENFGVLHGLDYQSKAGGLAPGETLVWSVAYPLDKLTQPFECEVSVTSAR